jgi:hypothetical protein
MNISVNDKKMSFKVFVEKVGKHFAHLPEAKRDAELKAHYEKATGRKPKVVRRKRA